MGEQGAESINNSINQLEKHYINMPNRVQRLEAIVHQHHLAVSPPLVVKKPPSEKSAKLQNNNSVVCLLVLVHWCTCASVGTLRIPLL